MEKKTSILKLLFKDLTINIIASMIVSGILIMMNQEFLKTQVPLWLFISILILIVPLIYQSFRLGVKKSLLKNRVFIISSALTSAPFFAELVKHLTYKLEVLGFIPEIKLSQEDFSLTEINRHIDSISINKEHYIGGFLIHSEVDKNFDKYSSFGKLFKNPIIFLDSKKSDLFQSFPDDCSFISYNNSKTGILAAEFTIQKLKKYNIDAPLIFIICSKLQTARQENFKLTIDQHFRNKIVEVNEYGGFNRRKAYKIAYDDLKTKLQNNSPIWDVIFCTNDEMALGVLNAINDLKSKKLCKIILVGVDGIEEAQREIDKGNTCFLNTVDQNPKLIVEEAVTVFMNKLSGIHATREQYIEPKMYK